MEEEVKTENNGKVKIAAVGDIHVREGDQGKWVDFFRRVSEEADILVISGDLTDTGDEEEAKILAEDLKECSIPVVCVLGNHDCEKGREKILRDIIKSRNVHLLDGESVIIKGIGFAGVKGFGGGFDNHMLSMFGERAIKEFVREAVDEAMQLDRALARLDASPEKKLKKIVVMHYSPVKATIVGEPEAIHPFLGCSHLAVPLDRRNVHAAFHGHAHIGQLEGETPGGVKVYNVSHQILERHGFEQQYYLLEV